MSMSNGVPKKRICIIGGGPSGITCIKQCRDEGLDVVCYERSDAIGGLWYYREDTGDGIASVARSTIINTSKEFSAFSDFPPPEHYPNYMHNSNMLRYFRSYAEHFGVTKYVKTSHTVVKITYNDDYDTTGRWKVTVEGPDGQRFDEVFDGVVISTGHHCTPLRPKFEGEELFKGKISHTHTYKNAKGYEDKIVAVVGIGNSGVDAAVELSFVTKVVYLVTRRGCWIRGRVGRSGWPVDCTFSTRAWSWFNSFLPKTWSDKLWEYVLNSAFDHDLYNLKPKHTVMEQHPTINDALPNQILSGRVLIKPNITRFTENGIIFENSNEEFKCDEVILATGYLMNLPFVDSDIIAPSNNEVHLFKNMFNPDLRHPQTLALIGLVQPLGPVHTTAEMQSRWYAALMAGHCKLPSKEEMKEIIAKDKNFIESIFYKSPRHSLEILYQPYVDTLAEYMGCKPNFMKVVLTDPVLAYHMFFDIITTYQFRLVGRHNWAGARNAIIKTNERIAKGLEPIFPIK